VALDGPCAAYAERILAWPDMAEWIEASTQEVEEVAELDIDF
jgi:glutathione S-transferase